MSLLWFCMHAVLEARLKAGVGSTRKEGVGERLCFVLLVSLMYGFIGRECYGE